MRRTWIFGLLVGLASGSATVAHSAEPQSRSAKPLSQQLSGFFEKHCTSCHGTVSAKGGLDLSKLSSDLNANTAAAREAQAVWVRIHDRVARGEMPPPPKKAPAVGDKSAFLAALSAELTTADAARRGTVLRRLNRVEYENTLRDVLGINADLQELLPEDGKAHGFDTVGEGLDISVVQLQRYMDAANRALDAATRRGPRPPSTTKDYSFAEGRNGENFGMHWRKGSSPGGAIFFNSGGFPAIQLSGFRAPVDGRYRVRISGAAFQSDEPVGFAVYIGSFGRNADSLLAGYYQLPPKASHVDIETHMARGDTVRLIPELNPTPQLRTLGPDKYTGRGLEISTVHIEGPLFDEWPGRGHKLLWGELAAESPAGPPVKAGKAGKSAKETKPAKEAKPAKPARPGALVEIVSDEPALDAEKLLTSFVPTVFRRPVAAAKIRPYLELAKAELADGASFEQAMRTAYVAVLCSPDFLYLIEPAGKLDDHALASRLSYFLWSTAPDAELLASAGRGELNRPDVLRQQTERLLADPRSVRFVTNFVGQWLNLRDIDFTTPDRKLYPEFDRVLQDAMVAETEQFFAEMIRANRPVTDIVDSDWTILNERLAEHYGIAGVKGPQMRRVPLRPEYHRGGVLTHGSVLKVSANGTNTSPVVRGAWVLERILAEPPPPPPPGIPGVEPDIRGATTLREQLDKHRTLPSCQGCHKVIDPPGFALESYDPIGGWRERYRIIGQAKKPTDTAVVKVAERTYRVPVGPKVDPTGELPDGRKFADLADYKRLLLADPDRLARAVTEKLAVYGTGRGMGFSDRGDIADIVAATNVASSAAGNVGTRRGLRDLIVQLVASPIFRNK